ncbi:MAG TPA: MFS transporter [Xanthobacteraceae bacterium]|nr:MFS transporter [Xanthobacteraceae bacterium]
MTQILAWGTLFYPPVLTVPPIAAAHGWSLAFAMSGLSVGLLAAGLIAPTVGRMIDRHGGHVVMTVGSLAGAAGLVALVLAAHPVAYLAAWVVIGAAMAASLYDPAFATLGRIFGAAARRPITVLTFMGGLASTVSWPATHVLLEACGWRGTYLVYAALLALVAAPLHALALPRERHDPQALPPVTGAPPPVHLPARGLPFWLVAIGFAAYAFVPSGLSAHLLAIFGRAGIDPATVVLIGALFGPAQVTSRLCEFAFAGGAHPLNLARAAFGLIVCAFIVLGIAGISAPVAAAFAVMFGVANGLVTIARGTVPLVLFGPAGYGRLIGRIAGPWLVMQSAAPLVLAFIAERLSDAAALSVVAGFALAALACFVMIRRPA